VHRSTGPPAPVRGRQHRGIESKTGAVDEAAVIDESDVDAALAPRRDEPCRESGIVGRGADVLREVVPGAGG
jgi:hypothetical protein